MEQFTDRLRAHADHVANMASHCDTEETTKQALILPLLDALGYSPYDPTKVKAEYKADLPGVKKDERVDYVLFSDSHPVMFIEAKSANVKLNSHAPQLARYFNATPGVCIAALTNGQEWKFFTDLQRENLMDEEPFFTVDFSDLQESHIKELSRFRYGSIRAEALRSFAEDLTYMAKFKDVLEGCLRDIDPDFVRFVASKAAPNVRLTQRALDTFTPLLKRAVAEAMSDLVRGSLNPPAAIPSPASTSDEPVGTGVIVDPTNSKIVTTADEVRIFDVARRLLSNKVTEEDITMKDTESYFSILYQGKNNRWLLRYNVNRKRPIVQFIMPLNDRHKEEIARAGLELSGENISLDAPDDLMRITGLLHDALTFCQDDNNFKRGSSE